MQGLSRLCGMTSLPRWRGCIQRTWPAKSSLAIAVRTDRWSMTGLTNWASATGPPSAKTLHSNAALTTPQTLRSTAGWTRQHTNKIYWTNAGRKRAWGWQFYLTGHFILLRFFYCVTRVYLEAI